MKRTNFAKTLPLFAAAWLMGPAAQAHEGHGLPGFAHWHGTDVVGFIAVAAFVALWMKGRK